MDWIRNPGRVTGFFYLLLDVLGIFGLLYVPGQLFVAGNAQATAQRIAAHESLLRIAIVADLASSIVLVLLVLAFYRLFKNVNQYLAVLLVIFGGIMPATIEFVNVGNYGAALTLITGPNVFPALTAAQHQDLAMLFLRIHHHVIMASELLWGLWLFPMAILTYKSGFLPRFLGVWLAINGFAYVVLFTAGWLTPQYYETLSNYAFPAQMSEIAMTLWLLVAGADPDKGVTRRTQVAATG